MIPVTLHSGEAKSEELDLDMLDSKDQSRIRFQRVNETTGKEVPWDRIVKGYKYDDDKYVVLTPADFKAAAKGMVRGGIEITDFVDRSAISPRYFEKPYFLEPAPAGAKVYALLREALRKSDRIGIARIVLQTRQHLAALMVEDDALVLITMRFPAELRDAGELTLPGSEAKVGPKELAMAMQLVEGLSGEWDPAGFKDEYTDALKAFVKQRTKSPDGGPSGGTEEADESIPETYNIMDALRQSLEQHGKGKARTSNAKTAKNAKQTAPSRKAKAVPKAVRKTVRKAAAQRRRAG